MRDITQIRFFGFSSYLEFVLFSVCCCPSCISVHLICIGEIVMVLVLRLQQRNLRSVTRVLCIC